VRLAVPPWPDEDGERSLLARRSLNHIAETGIEPKAGLRPRAEKFGSGRR
jgi:hypothetical protein